MLVITVVMLLWQKNTHTHTHTQMAATAFAFGDVLREVHVRQASGGQSTSSQGQETKIQMNMWRS